MGREQHYSNSCGAACLITAGVKIGSVSNSDRNSNAFEEEVYKHTSLEIADAYNMPSGIINACFHLAPKLGVKVKEIRLQGMVFPKELKKSYPNEIANVQKSDVPIVESRTRTSGYLSVPNGTLEMFVVIVGKPSNGILHWLLHYGGNKYCDPATGKDYNWWTSKNSWGYWDTGLSIILEKGVQAKNCSGKDNKHVPNVVHKNILVNSGKWV